MFSLIAYLKKRRKFKLTGSARGYFLIFFFWIFPVWFRKDKILLLIDRIKDNKSFDTSALDFAIADLAPKVNDEYRSKDRNIGYLATGLYDVGGHSKCLAAQAEMLAEDYRQIIFLTRVPDPNHPLILSKLKTFGELVWEDINIFNWRKKVKILYNKIIAAGLFALIVYIHPDDVFGAMLLAMIKKNTDIKVIYCPHASHYPNLGLTFADLSLEGSNCTAYITKHFRHFDKVYISVLCGKSRNQIPVFNEIDLLNKRKQLGIGQGEKFTVSGGTAYKFFDNDKSEYFTVIKKLLLARSDVRHLVISNFDETQKGWIKNFFDEDNLTDRLLLLPLCADYELLFACADIYIDSFPVSGALTMIDLMALKVPYAVKINRENALWSFHEYQRPDYPFMYETDLEMLNGVQYMLDHPDECAKQAELNYQYYLNKYESGVCRKQLLNLLENLNETDKFITQLPDNLSYKFGGADFENC